jgi:hypothetical protein
MDARGRSVPRRGLSEPGADPRNPAAGAGSDPGIEMFVTGAGGGGAMSDRDPPLVAGGGV